LTGVYTYACKDQRWLDYYYIFRYPAFWYAPASMALLHSLASLCVKVLLMHAYASLFMLLSQSNCREAFAAELERRRDRLRRWWKPRPPVRLIPIEAGDLCAFCHEELVRPPPEDDEDTSQLGTLGRAGVTQAAGAADALASMVARSPPPSTPLPDPKELARFVVHCRWGCGKAVHKACASGWGRNSCVFCAAPMS